MAKYLDASLNFLKNSPIGELLILVAGFPIIVYMLFMIFAFWWKSKPLKGPDRWYLYVMSAYLFSFLWIFISYADIIDKYRFLAFLPINLLFWIGPLLFQFSKSKLYNNFRFRGQDLKHYIIPIAHFSFYFFAFLLPSDQKFGLFNQ